MYRPTIIETFTKKSSKPNDYYSLFIPKFFYAQKLVKLQQSRVTWVVTHAELTEKNTNSEFLSFAIFLQTKPRVTLLVTQAELTKKTKF